MMPALKENPAVKEETLNEDRLAAECQKVARLQRILDSREKEAAQAKERNRRAVRTQMENMKLKTESDSMKDGVADLKESLAKERKNI